MRPVMTIEGLGDYLRTLEQAPDTLIKCVRKAMRKAGSELARDIRSGTPRSFQPLVKSKVTKAKLSRNLSSAIGLYKGKTSGKEIPEWFKAYWKNYGTLQRRDPAHRFDRPVKPDNSAAARRRRNNLGQFSEGFFEDSLPGGWESRYVATFRREMRAQGYDM